MELPDGRILQNSRYNEGHERQLSHSDDGGTNFDDPRPMSGVPDPGVNADQILVDPDNGGNQRNRMLFSNPAHPTERRDLTVRLSCAVGQTWPANRRLHTGPAGYSTMAMLPNGRIGVLAETGDADYTEEIEFHSLSVDDIGRC